MVLAVKVPKEKANSVKDALMSKSNLDKTHKVGSTEGFILFPILKKFKTSYAIVEAELEKFEAHETKLKSALSQLLTEKELEHIKTAYDAIGDIAILEIDETFRGKEQAIGEALLSLRKDIKVVLRKEGRHEGEFRTQKMAWLAGEKRTETVHKENNVLLKLDVEQVYFSPRLSTERKRIAELVKASKKKENILVMFSGCAPYCCVIARNAKEKVNSIVGIEINPEGHRYAIENIRLNHLSNIDLINDDVNNVLPGLAAKHITFDRILMPLPKHAEDFLDVALSVSKKGTFIHFYNFMHEDEFGKAKAMIKNACDKAGKKFKIQRLVKCGQFSPSVYRICVDFKVM